MVLYNEERPPGLILKQHALGFVEFEGAEQLVPAVYSTEGEGTPRCKPFAPVSQERPVRSLRSWHHIAVVATKGRGGSDGHSTLHVDGRLWGELAVSPLF